MASRSSSSYGLHSQTLARRRPMAMLTLAVAILTGILCHHAKDMSHMTSLVVPDGQQPALPWPAKTKLVKQRTGKVEPARGKTARGPPIVARERQGPHLPPLPDWQLDDQTLVDAFRLYEADNKHQGDIDQLAPLHPFDRDSRIAKFDPVSHVFYITNPDGEQVACRKGVTSLLRRYSHGFNAEEAIRKMKQSHRWETKQEEFRKEDGAIMSDAEIKAFWSFKGKISSTRGSLLHAEIERNLNGYEPQGPLSPEFEQFLQFKEEELDKLQVWRTEAILFHCGLRACGIADLLCRDESGRLVIMDWKRSNKISLSNPYERLKAPVANLDDCNFNQYSLQLNMYRYILESEYGEEVSSMRLVQLHPHLSSCVVREIKRMDKEVEAIVDHLQRLDEASEPCEGEHAVFQADW